MTGRRALIVVAHGAGVLLLGLVLGLAAVAEELAGTQPQTWRAGHGALLLAGVWLLALGAVLPRLTLTDRQEAALCWSVVGTAYAFTIAILVQAITGVRALAPSGTASSWVAYLANLLTVGGGLVAASLTLLGALGSLRSRT